MCVCVFSGYKIQSVHVSVALCETGEGLERERLICVCMFVKARASRVLLVVFVRLCSDVFVCVCDGD